MFISYTQRASRNRTASTVQSGASVDKAQEAYLVHSWGDLSRGEDASSLQPGMGDMTVEF